MRKHADGKRATSSIATRLGALKMPSKAEKADLRIDAAAVEAARGLPVRAPPYGAVPRRRNTTGDVAHNLGHIRTGADISSPMSPPPPVKRTNDRYISEAQVL